MPHMPDSHHDTHDLELVAAFAAGDATGADLETATALVAACTDCAELHRDLRAIAVAIPELPAPVRPRDFRLTPEQAASLRPRGIRGLLAAFASPKLSFATPLGTGLAALGVVGVLVASGGLPLAGGGATGETAFQEPAAPGTEAPAAAAVPGPSFEILASSPDAEDAVRPVLPVASDGRTTQGDTAAGEPVDELEGGVAPSPAAEARSSALDADAAAAARPADQTLFILAGLAIVVGMALVAMRWVARRVV